MRKAYGDKNFNLIRIDKRPNLERVSDASSLKYVPISHVIGVLIAIFIKIFVEVTFFF